ncbi:hypothetical protein PM082_009601 [Marasmius tenuissimus]|nr:hypothetical protein PM082_009601 [Marasmius tenuissimus]
MRRFAVHALTLFLCLALQPRKTRAEQTPQSGVLLDTSAIPLPSQIPVSQEITVAWNRTTNTRDLNFELIYLDPESRSTSTQTVTHSTTGSSVLAPSSETTALYGVIKFTPQAAGPVEIVAYKTDSTVGEGTALSTFKTIATLQLAAITTPTSAPPGTNEMSTTAFTDPPGSSGTDHQNPTTPKKTLTEIIIGTVIGGTAFLVLVVVVFLLLRRHYRQRERIEHPEAFHRDLMVVKTVTTETSASSIVSSWSWKQRREKRRLGGNKGSRDSVAASINSTTPLRETPEDDRSSVVSGSSLYTRSSADASSSISSTDASSSDAASYITTQSLTPVSVHPSSSPAHVQSPSRARTDRQMQIEEKIIELQGRLIAVSGSGQGSVRTRAELEQRIEEVKDLRESEWAYGGEGEVPDVLTD